MIYRIADFLVRLEAQHLYTRRICRPYLVADASASCKNEENASHFQPKLSTVHCPLSTGELRSPPPDFTVATTPEEIAAEQALSGLPIGLCESVCLYRRLCALVLPHDAFLLHAAVVEKDGRGYAFLGESGAGKSTHMALWLKYLDANIINGDKPLVRKVESGKWKVESEGCQGDNSSDSELSTFNFQLSTFFAYGTPWAGKEGLQRNASVALSAMVFIEQGERNEIVRLTPGDCVRRIFHQMLVPKTPEAAARLLALADAFVRAVPAYRLTCDISRQAAQLCFAAVENGKWKVES